MKISNNLHIMLSWIRTQQEYEACQLKVLSRTIEAHLHRWSRILREVAPGMESHTSQESVINDCRNYDK